MEYRTRSYSRYPSGGARRPVSTATVSDGELRDCSCFLCQRNRWRPSRIVMTKFWHETCSRTFFCLTPAELFFRPDRSSTAPSCRVAVKDGRTFRGHPKGLSLMAASTMARWPCRSGRRPRVTARQVSSPRRSPRLPSSRSRGPYRIPGTPFGKPIDYFDFATIKLLGPAYLVEPPCLTGADLTLQMSLRLIVSTADAA